MLVTLKKKIQRIVDEIGVEIFMNPLSMIGSSGVLRIFEKKRGHFF